MNLFLYPLSVEKRVLHRWECLIAAKALTAGSEQAQFGFGDSFESSPSK